MPCTLNPKPKPQTLSAAPLVVRRKWLPTVHQCRSHHNTGFPSDHYLLAASLQVKLGARPPAAPRPPKLEYQVDENTRQQFCQTFRSAYVRPRTDTPVPTLEYFVYTDGSGSKGRATTSTPAGWGVYIQQGHSEIVGHGKVNTDYSSPYFLGAQVGSNNTGELTALIEAMLYLLHDTVKASCITLYHDSKWAAQMVRGQARPKRHATMVHHARKIYSQLQEKSDVRWEWVKGHSGVAGNARADALAEQGKNSTRSEGLRYAQKPPLLIVDITDQPPDYSSTHSKYQKFLQAVKTAEQLHFHPKEHAPRQLWISQDTLQQLNHAKHLKAQEDPAYYTYYREVKKTGTKGKKGLDKGTIWPGRQAHAGHVAHGAQAQKGVPGTKAETRRGRQASTMVKNPRSFRHAPSHGSMGSQFRHAGRNRSPTRDYSSTPPRAGFAPVFHDGGIAKSPR